MGSSIYVHDSLHESCLVLYVRIVSVRIFEEGLKVSTVPPDHLGDIIVIQENVLC